MNTFNIPQQVSHHQYQYQMHANLMTMNGGNNNHGGMKRSSQRYTSRAKKPGLNLHEMTPQQKNDLKKRYVIWTQQAIKQLQVKFMYYVSNVYKLDSCLMYNYH